MAEKVEKMEAGLADLKQRAPVIGNIAERVAQRMLAAKLGKQSANQAKSGKVIRWIIIAFVLMFFVFPFISTLLIAIFSGLG